MKVLCEYKWLLKTTNSKTCNCFCLKLTWTSYQCMYSYSYYVTKSVFNFALLHSHFVE